MASMMASLPLHLLCQLIMPNITANHYGTAVKQLPQQQSVVQQLLEGYVEYPDQGVAYKFHTDVELTWVNARKKCVSEGAHLAVIDTREKVENIAKFHPGDEFHVGFYSAYGDDKEWVSVTSGGEPVSNLPWKDDEPYDDLECVMLTQSGLETCSCSFGLRHFICERPIPPSPNSDQLESHQKIVDVAGSKHAWVGINRLGGGAPWTKINNDLIRFNGIECALGTKKPCRITQLAYPYNLR